MVYSVAAAGVVMDVDTREQRFHLGHGDDVSALAVSPCGEVVPHSWSRRLFVLDSEGLTDSVSTISARRGLYSQSLAVRDERYRR